MRIEQLNHTERYGYVYDALGRRIEKHRLDRDGKPCNRTTFLWDRMQMIQENSADKRQSLYLYTDEGSYEPLARIDRTGNQEQHIYYFHTDLNGLPEELTDEAGEIVWECSYQLWGKPIQESAHREIQQNLRYQGQYLDRETGLHYNTFRYYDPDIGRFTQPDPIGLAGGYNLYQYAPNAFMWIDPYGLCRRGNQKTKKHMDEVRDKFLSENDGKVTHTHGGRDALTGKEKSERYFKPLEKGRKGGSYADMTFETHNGQRIHIQTVDKGHVNGMTRREWENAKRILKQDPDAIVIAVPKGTIPSPGVLDVSKMESGNIYKGW
ncbi:MULTISPECIES: RHS repeat-associated core domain-containing protein [unclassified Snodgrassella]|uniref:RHS repeat domain-containing protein n=1 Tax=unclassified Snodgrassella TaxID=2625236 RepID=UPI0018DE3DE0|nr:RHS domain-containing protein [Snodgrassella sp. M0110]MBI0076543.1 RHS domain-containing protein [Snodgrassella sp. M0118]MBI0078793.1 RHS domain-containing protein [Snodgrassella sp. M0112]